MATFTGPNTPTVAGSLIPAGYQQIAGLAGVTSLTVPPGARIAVISVSGSGVRYRDDGTAPTAALGMPIAAGGSLTYVGALAALQLIPQIGNPTLDIAYYW